METRHRRRPWLWIAVAAMFAGTSLCVLATPARAADDYPYASADPDELDERGFYYRHCTSFVAWRMAQRGEFHNYMHGGHWWHARNWAANAQEIGFAVDTTPAAGAIAHWYAGEQGADELGHVAVVEAVHGDGSVTVEEYNGTNPLGYSRRGPTRAPRYIHVYDDPSVPTNVEIAAPAEAVRRRVEAAATQRTPDSDEPVAIAVDDPPTGYLTRPVATRRLSPGQVITVSGRFSDDSGVAKVRFLVSDDAVRWRLIGTDPRAGNDVYAVRWKVDVPAGSRIGFRAEAIDDAGNRSMETIGGLDDIRVVRRLGAQPSAVRDGEQASLQWPPTERSSADSRVVPLLPPVAVIVLSGVSLRRRATRAAA